MDKMNVVIPTWILKRKIEVEYLVIDEFDREAIKAEPSEAFYKMISRHMNAYMKDGKMPPADVAPAILNLADDYSAGRKLTIRAGDYISLQNYLRKEMP